MTDPACLLSYNSNTDLESRQFWLHLYNKDLKVKKPSGPCAVVPSGLKASVFEFSSESRQRLLRVCRNNGHLIKSQFLLSYPAVFPTDGKVVKSHLNAFLTLLRKHYGESELCYLWCLEFQQRGAPHIHFFSSLIVNDSNRKFLASSWVRIIGGGQQALNFHSHRNNFFAWEMSSGAYLSKEYLAKSVQKDVPEEYKNVGRFWGHSRNMKPLFKTINPYDYEEHSDVVTGLKKVVRIITKRAQKVCIERKKSAVARRREKNRETGKPPAISKRNYRKTVRTYTLPLMAAMFITMVNYYIPNLI